jgi:hypothetical protein
LFYENDCNALRKILTAFLNACFRGAKILLSNFFKTITMNEILSIEQIRSFITNGYIRIDNAFSEEIANEARNILWNDLPVDRHDPATWTQPVIRLGMYTHQPFIKAANSTRLHSIFNQLAGENKWVPCMSMGTFPVRFPFDGDPGDTGWHIDAGFPGDDPNNYFEWRINVWSKGRGLLMLFLFSDVGEHDAPTRIKKGSHLDVAKLLEPYGDDGLSFMELAQKLQALPKRDEALATGKAGTVYLCHPFIAHGAQGHTGTKPRFMAQPPLLIKGDYRADCPTVKCAVAEAIKLGLKS